MNNVDDEKMWQNLAEVQELYSEWKEPIEFFKNAIEREKWCKLAETHEKNGEWKEAIECYKKSFLMKPITIVCLLAVVVLAVGCFRLPIGYYTFLRIVVFAAAVCFIVLNRGDGFGWRNLVTALIGILFNPIIPVYLHSKTAWTVIDAVCAVWFVVMALVWKGNNEN